jgi:hypothetical protein
VEEVRLRLRRQLSALSASVDRRLRAQTWVMTSTMVTAVGLAATLAAAFSR